MRDMYGPPPAEVVNLLTVSLVRNRASALGADEARLMRGKSALVFRRARDVSPSLAAAAEKGRGQDREQERLFGAEIPRCGAEAQRIQCRPGCRHGLLPILGRREFLLTGISTFCTLSCFGYRIVFSGGMLQQVE